MTSSRPLHVSALHTLPSERRSNPSTDSRYDGTSSVAIHPLRQHPPSFIIHEDDDYAASDTAYHGFVTAPPAAHTASPSIVSSSSSSTCYNPEPSPLEDFPTSNEHLQSHASSIFDKVKIPPIVSSTASRASLHFGGTRTPSPERQSRPRSRPSLSNWFAGTSAPVSFAINTSPTRSHTEQDSDDSLFSDMETIFTTRPGRGRTNTSTSQTTTASSSLASKFSWITKGISTLPATAAAAAAAASTLSYPPSPIKERPLDSCDELLTLDISQALLPHGTPDILAPSSFHDLLAASEALCQRYKAAYRAKVHQASDLLAEKDAGKDELDEAETRCRHFKMQLDGMSAKAKEQEENIRKLRLELLAERRRREDEERARRRSVQIVRGGRGASQSHQRKASSKFSPSSNISASDSGFESDGNSTDSSTRSRRTSVSSQDFDSASASPTLAEHESFEEHHEGQRMQVNRRLSTYDKVLKTVAAGEPASTWAVAEGYREENRELKARIRDLEDAVANALDMVVCMGV